MSVNQGNLLASHLLYVPLCLTGLVAGMWMVRDLLYRLNSESNESRRNARAWVQQGGLFCTCQICWQQEQAGTHQGFQSVTSALVSPVLSVSSTHACFVVTVEDWCCASSLIQICVNMSTCPISAVHSLRQWYAYIWLLAVCHLC